MFSFIDWLFQTINHTVQLDIVDLCYLYKPRNIDFKLSLQSSLPKRGIIIRIGSFLFHMVSSIWEYPLRAAPFAENAVFLFSVTHNQDRSLLPITKNFPDAYYVGLNQYGNHQIPIFWAYLLAVPFFPLVIIEYFRSDNLQKRAFSYVFDSYWLSYGFYVLLRWLLRKVNPPVVIVANDHVMLTRTLIQAAAAETVPTIYIQHASVTEHFPALTVNYAFLEGIDSAEKYVACGPSDTKVFLVGIPRFDKYSSMIKTNNNVQTVGICVGMLETEEQTSSLCYKLNSNLPELDYVLRPHPADPRRAMWQAFTEEINWMFSDGKEVDTFQFLNQTDVILAGDSNILLEAALMDVFPIYYDFSGEKMDWYGFYKNGLVPHFADSEHVIQFLKEMIENGRSSIRFKARHYCATIDTNYDGRSAELASNLVEDISSGLVNLANWEKVVNEANLTVYELKPEST